ncbi:thioesterase family protein [Dietzia sp. B19]|uniref:thioesterase family protein n=1 Tax=Dietzia sp. B19 TaxID=1630632 RepID=UPI0015FA988F|nr:thioesterase family protein [Dietzia sp. B19]MBB1056672.1 thioesterase family protein [Dietzia sp. B19]
MSLKSMLESASRGGSVEITDGWTQGRAIYGGLTGALLLASIKGRLRDVAGSGAGPGSLHPLRSFTVSFVGPATPGPVEVHAEILRVGKNVTQAQATLRQDGAIVATALAAFGKHRESTIVVPPRHPMPELPEPGTIEPFPYIEKMTPEFYKFLALRQFGGALPFSGAETGDLSGWAQLREAPEELHEEHLLVLADAWPPATIQMLSGFAPASSLTWTLELVAEIGPDTIPPEALFAYEATTDASRDGYAHTHAMMWRPDGALTAISRQTITVFG